MFLEFFFIIVILLFVAITLLLRRKLFCIIGGFTYLGAGIIGFLLKIIYICYLLFTGKLNESFDKSYSKNYLHYAIFVVLFGLLIVRMYDCYLIKIMYKSLGFFERYAREKEHAEFIEKLGNKMGEGKKDEQKNNQDDICDIKFAEEDPDEYNENQI